MPSPLLTENDCRLFVEQLLFPATGTQSNETKGCIGIELENFAYKISNQGYYPVPLFGNDSLVEGLLKVSTLKGGVPKYHGTSTLYKVELPGGDSFLFEPGGQVEISTAPRNNVRSLEDHLLSAQKILAEVTQQFRIHFGQRGTNPLFDGDRIVNQLQLARYIALEDYFNSIGPYGRQMMMQTCGLHINMDAGQDDTTRLKRIIAANLLVPFSTALFANSPNIGTRKTGYRSYRSYIWQHADPLRTGILPLERIIHKMDRDALVDAYLEFALNAPLIFIPELGSTPLPRSFTMRYWLNNTIEGLKPGPEHLKNHFSLLFPEVRLKGYLELRSIDAPPVEWQMIPVLFYTALLYSEEHLDKTLEYLSPLAPRIHDLLKQSAEGFATGELYHYSMNLMQLAINGLSSFPPDFMHKGYIDQLNGFNERFTMQRKTFADDHY